MFCGKCGNQVPDGNMFCTFCGNPVQGAAQAQQPEVQQLDTPVMQPGYDTPQVQNDTPAQQFGGQYQQTRYDAPQPQSVPQFNGQQPAGGAVQKRGDPVKVMVVVIVGLAIAAVILLAVNLGRNGAFSSSRDRDDDDDDGTAISVTDIKTANGNAKSAYNIVAEYCADQQIKGISLNETMNEISGKYDLSRTDYTGFGGDLCTYMRDNGVEEGYVYVMKTDIDDYNSFATQWSPTGESGYEGGVIGQYPDPIQKEYQENVDFGSYYGKEDRASNDLEDDFDEDDINVFDYYDY